MESFSEQLKAEVEPIWRKIFAHPFLKEIKTGTLPLEKFQYYLGQDYLYLEGFARTIALAMSKTTDSQTLEALYRRVFTPIERPLHSRLLTAARLSEADVQRARPSPTNTAYVNHMLRTASQHGLGPTAAALLPCPWTYHELRHELGQSEHPLYGQWTGFYVSGALEESVDAWRGFVDTAAAEAGPAEQDAMREAFMTSSRYEYMFWDMAYRMEEWAV